MYFSRMVFGKNFSCFRYLNCRFYSLTQSEGSKRGLLLGVFSDNPEQYSLTKSAEQYNRATSGKLSALLDRLKLNPQAGEARVLYDVSPEYLAVCVVGLGAKNKPCDELEEYDAEKESVRVAVAAGANALRSIGIKQIDVEDFCDAESAAEGVTLKLWNYDELRNEKMRKQRPAVKLYSDGPNAEKHQADWNAGVIKGDAQNLARRLTDTPANLMTPTIFAENATKLFEGMNSVELLVRDKNWAVKQGMNTFLSVAKGSCEPPLFLEIKYVGDQSNKKPVVLVGKVIVSESCPEEFVSQCFQNIDPLFTALTNSAPGKGITFDTGGINIKSTAGLADMRGDKGGAGCVLATVHAAAKLCLPVNITVLIPLCENMPSGNANKPGDVITAMNGKTVRIDNTDAEGRLILADALTYAKNFDPKFILDVATLTGAMSVALGSEATGVFTNSTPLWKELQAAGMYTGDRVWRFPLWKGYATGLTKHTSVDISNITKRPGGGACSAAAFLREFIPAVDWMHLDIAGVMGPNDKSPYLDEGMTGRPTRTLIQFLRSFR